MVLFVGLCFFEFLWCLSNMIMKPRKLSTKKIFDGECSHGHFDPEFYRSTIKREFTIKSRFGYTIACELLTPKSGEDARENHIQEAYMDKVDGVKIVVLCHGLGCSRYTSLKYAQMFLRMGYHVLQYDHRNHGTSGKALTSMGYYEKYDLKRVVDWCYHQFGKGCFIITHGESMGAATALLHLEIDQRVCGVIADCAYSDLTSLLVHQLKQYYHLPKILIPIVSELTYVRAGFWYRDVSPIKVVKNTKIPILFIHGKRDSFVPTRMSKEMYLAKRRQRVIYLVAGAKHGESFLKRKDRYSKVVKRFCDQIYLEYVSGNCS